MKEMFPLMSDVPEKQTRFAALVYAFLSFFSIPFLFTLFMLGMYDDEVALAWCEIAYHIFNFVIVLCLFREYLADAFFTVRYNLKKVAETVLICVLLSIGIMYILFQWSVAMGSDHLWYAFLSMIPIAEMEIFCLSSSVVLYLPLVGTLCMVILTPVATSCLLYATGFAPWCSKSSWRGYLGAAIVLLLARGCMILSGWDAAYEMLIYLGQLPIHLIACWGYQRTDCIWTPIFTHMACNLIGSIALQVLFTI